MRKINPLDYLKVVKDSQVRLFLISSFALQKEKSLYKILIIDDLESNRYFFSHHLKSVGYQVIEAETGREGIEKAQEEPDLIILDINLPDMNGMEVCSLLKGDTRLGRIPVIQTSASFINTHDHVKGIECGADSYLNTPIDPLIFLSTVKAWLRVRKSDKLLIKNLELLEQEKELRERFVSTLTHDLRTPLTAAKLGAQLLSKKSDIDSPNQTIANRIVANIDRTDSMIRDLLDANLIKAGEKLPLKILHCQLDELLEDAVTEQGSVYGDVFILNNYPIDGYWDCQAIRRIIENLSSNAVKYGNPLEKVSFKLTYDEKADQVQIEIHNFGNPIDSDTQIEMFNPYKRAESSKDQKGWGLGLSLIKGLTEAHGGTVSVKSDKEHGTTFSVVLPRDSRKSVTP